MRQKCQHGWSIQKVYKIELRFNSHSDKELYTTAQFTQKTRPSQIGYPDAEFLNAEVLLQESLIIAAQSECTDAVYQDHCVCALKSPISCTHHARTQIVLQIWFTCKKSHVKYEYTFFLSPKHKSKYLSIGTLAILTQLGIL